MRSLEHLFGNHDYLRSLYPDLFPISLQPNALRGEFEIHTAHGLAVIGARELRRAAYGGDDAPAGIILKKLDALVPYEDWTHVAAWQSAGAIDFGEMAKGAA